MQRKRGRGSGADVRFTVEIEDQNEIEEAWEKRIARLNRKSRKKKDEFGFA